MVCCVHHVGHGRTSCKQGKVLVQRMLFMLDDVDQREDKDDRQGPSGHPTPWPHGREWQDAEPV